MLLKRRVTDGRRHLAGTIDQGLALTPQRQAAFRFLDLILAQAAARGPKARFPAARLVVNAATAPTVMPTTPARGVR
jgi:hypothetical protein